MKEKNMLYRPGSRRSATVPLTTLGLFQPDGTGRLEYTPPGKPVRQARNPRAEERRFSRRFEWRHDVAGWTVTAQGRTTYFEARSCDVSRMGCCLLVDHELDAGAFLDIQVCDLDELDLLPFVQVLECRPKGRVWQVRCLWLQPLQKIQVRCLLGQTTTPMCKTRARTRRYSSTWLQRLWRRFQTA